MDNEVVGVAANVAKEQFEADDDTSVQQRLLMAGGTTLQESSGMVDDQIGSGVWRRWHMYMGSVNTIIEYMGAQRIRSRLPTLRCTCRGFYFVH